MAVPDQTAQAMQKFFRPGNLTALREMALRHTAAQVDDQMRAYKKAHAIFNPWAATDRLLVCISANPLSERLVRAGRRLADQLDVEWFVLYVETPGYGSLPEDARDRVARTLHLAEDLGGRSITVAGQDVAEAILDYARSHNVTKIIVGKSLEPRWRELFRGSIVDRIIHNSDQIDVYVISARATRVSAVPRLVPRPNQGWQGYLVSAGLVIAVTLAGLPIRAAIAPTNLVMLYLLAVVIAATRWGRGPSVLSAVLSVLFFDFFLVPPYLTFRVSDAQYLLTFIGLLVVGLVVSTLAAREREQAEMIQRRETYTAALYAPAIRVHGRSGAIIRRLLHQRAVPLQLGDLPAAGGHAGAAGVQPWLSHRRRRLRGGQLGVPARAGGRAGHRHVVRDRRALPAARDGTERDRRGGRQAGERVPGAQS